MPEEYKVTLVVECYNSPPTEIRFLRKEWLKKSEQNQKYNISEREREIKDDNNTVNEVVNFELPPNTIS